MRLFEDQSGTLEEVGRKLDVSPRTLDDYVRRGIHPPERGRNEHGELLWNWLDWEELLTDMEAPLEPYTGFPGEEG